MKKINCMDCGKDLTDMYKRSIGIMNDLDDYDLTWVIRYNRLNGEFEKGYICGCTGI